MEYSPTLTVRLDWSQVAAAVRSGFLGESALSAQNPSEVAAVAVVRGPLYKIWHAFLNLVIILTIGFAFAWFGPDVLYGFTSGMAKLAADLTHPTPAVSQTKPNVQHWPQFLQFNNWFSGLTVTPIAGQSGVATSDAQTSPTPSPTPVPYTPPYNPDLPDGKWLVIPRIGVRSELQKEADFEKALSTGLWQVPDFGDPGSRDLPMIVAAHRYGWDWWWKTDYWKYHSFYLLPKLEPGDQIEVIADHRKWIYQVYAGEEGAEISDYSADLILYTCKDLHSPLRFFRYAKLVVPTESGVEK